MTATQADKANQFRALHEASEAFVIPNADPRTRRSRSPAREIPARPSSSPNRHPIQLGRRDGRVTREETLTQARVICDVTDLRVVP